MPRFCIIENSDAWNRPLVLDIKTLVAGYPYAVDFREGEEIARLMDDLAQERCPMAKVPGYTIFVTPHLNLSGEEYTVEDLRESLRGMARFFLDYKIAKGPGKYTRFQEDYVPQRWTGKEARTDE